MSNDIIKNGDDLTKSLDIVSDNISKLKESLNINCASCSVLLFLYG